MRLLYITPPGVGNMSPQIEMANFLRPRFEKLDLVVTGRSSLNLQNNDWDIVFGAIDACIPYAVSVAKRLNLPIYSHWEWLPPFRLYGYETGEDPLNWGFRQEHVSGLYKNRNYFRHYTDIIRGAIDSNVSSCAGVTFKEKAKIFSNNQLDNCFIKYPASPMPLDKKRNLAKEDYFITVSRLAPNKRVAELAMAVREANIDTTWVIVGGGAEKPQIENILKNCKTRVKFIPNTNGEKKFFFLSRAKFQLSAWHGIPQLEAALVGTSTINLEIDYIKELYSDYITWASDIKDMAHKIKEFYNNPKLCDEKSDILYEAARNNKLNINTLEQGADIIYSTLQDIYNKTRG